MSASDAAVVRTFLCWFCGSSEHRINECPIQEEYIVTKKWIIKKENGELRLKDGGYVSRGEPGETRQQKVDKIAKQKGWDKSTTVMFATEAENEAAYGSAAESSMESLMWQMILQRLSQLDTRFDAIEGRSSDSSQSKN